jgi:cellulose synthase/poly-beta-1,6-N-acetylglucosamine synthase-like glycosyltransferase
VPEPQLTSSSTEAIPRFRGSARPEPESPVRKLWIRSFGVVAIIATYAYLAWRFGMTIDLSVWWIALPLFLAEAHNGLGLTLYTLGLWDVDVSPPWHTVDETPLRIAVLLPTYQEPEEVLLPSIAAAVALEPAHETWVLDDGRRPEVRRLAERLGAHYLTRDDNHGAKAGNLNNALEQIEADVIAVFDADHVAQRNFLRHTLAYFDDPRVAVVQTPQDFYNLDSFEHEGVTQDDHRPYNEEAVFYRVIAPAKNLWGGAFWCGTGAMVRVTALRDVGMVATETITEDIHTTIRMNRRGWKAIYHNEVLARGLAPTDASQYMLQRHRWALGAMQVIRMENPLTGRGLTFGQRLAFASTLFGWFDSWRTLVFLLLPTAVVLTGAVPIDAPASQYVPAFLAVFVIQSTALGLLSRGFFPPITSLLFEMVRLPAVLPATFALITGGRGATFQVTPKGAAEERTKTTVPPLLTALEVLAVISLVWFFATMAGLTPTNYHQPAVAIGASFFLLGNLTLLTMAVRRIADPRFASNRRASVRFGVRLFGAVGNVRCEIEDLSTTGAKLLLARPKAASVTDETTLTVELPNGERPVLRAHVQRRLDRTDGFEIGLEFDDGQQLILGRIAIALLQHTEDADTTEAPLPAVA